jgi:hypothetical protein
MMTNAFLVWGSTEPCKRNARYFYDDWRLDTNFIGSAWYSSRSLFGEPLTVVRIDALGRVADAREVHTHAIEMFAFKYSARTNSTTK